MTTTLGVDLGQKRDPTAIAVVETQRRPVDAKRTVTHYRVRHLERLPIGSSFPQTATELARLVTGVRERAGSSPAIYVDATGLGQPVVDLIKAEIQGGRVGAVYFTHGDRLTEESGETLLGKAYLVARLQTLLQSGRLHLPRSQEAEALAEELLSYEIHIEPDANERYGAFRVGPRDDLVTALGLAVHREPRVLHVVWGLW